MQTIKIKSVKNIGPQQVYSIRLASEPHTYKIQGGIVSANSHSSAYALNTYWTMWLRHYYPMEFLVSQMNVYLSDETDMAKLIKEAKNVGVKVLMPDFRYSKYHCTIEGTDTIRVGFGSIKGVGESINDYITAFRDADLDPMDFIQIHKRSIGSKKTMSKKNMEALIYSGAFDYIGKHRTELSKTYEFYEEAVGRKFKNKDYPIRFQFMAENEAGYLTVPDSELESASVLETRMKEYMPFRSFGTKLEGFEGVLYDELRMTPIGDLAPSGKRTFRVPGIITGIMEFNDKRKNKMARVTVEDSFGSSATAMIFSSIWTKASEECQIGKGICLDCTIGEYKGKISINATNVTSLKKILTLHLK